MRFADQLWRMLKLDGGGIGRKDFKLQPIDSNLSAASIQLYGEKVTDT